MIELIYKYRYFNLLMIENKKSIYETKELKNSLKKLTKELIDKAIQMKVIIKILENDELNYNLTENLLLSKTISLQDINIKILNEKDGIYMKIFDEQIEENKIKIENITKQDVKIKINKITKLFI